MAIKRVVTYFGVPIPPFKEPKLEKGSTTIRFVITGSIPSKKNNSQSIVIRKEARNFIKDWGKNKQGVVTIKEAMFIANEAVSLTHSKIMPNLKYNEWIEQQRPIIEKQREFWMNRLQEKGLYFPLSKANMSIRFYFSKNYFIDSISKQESVQDLLTDLKIITDDNYTVLNPISVASANYKEEIIYNICFVSLTFKLKPPEGYIKKINRVSSNKFIKKGL